jgi:olefin beta-lactone synthetase
LNISGVKIRIAIDNCAAQKDVMQFSDLLKGKAKKIDPVKKNDTALITYTTGSTGAPKGANRTHRFLASQHYALKRLFPYKSNDIDLPVFPVFALNNIASGITTVIPAINISRPDPEDSKTLVSQIKACEVSCMTLAPSSFRNVAGYCSTEKISLDGISRVLTGGAPISETDILRFMKAAPHSKNWILYGSTEVEPIAYIESREMLSIKPPRWKNTTKIGVNVGKIDKALNYKFINIETGNIGDDFEINEIEVNIGEVGELIVAGEHVCEEYYKNEEAFARAKIRDKNGVVWHRTGDLARMDKDGFLWIVGRKHNIIKRGAEYFFPVRPEIILKDLSPVVNAAYLNIDHNDKKIIIAVVTLERESEAIKKSCRKEIAKVFEKNKLPLDRVVFMKEVPMDVRHHSKVDYDKLRQKLYEVLA